MSDYTPEDWQRVQANIRKFAMKAQDASRIIGGPESRKEVVMPEPAATGGEWRLVEGFVDPWQSNERREYAQRKWLDEYGEHTEDLAMDEAVDRLNALEARAARLEAALEQAGRRFQQIAQADESKGREHLRDIASWALSDVLDALLTPTPTQEQV